MPRLRAKGQSIAPTTAKGQSIAPITAKEFHSLLAPLMEPNGGLASKTVAHQIPIAVGVSGGSHSMALAALLHKYYENRKVYYLIVDHRFRPVSTKEATDTATRLAKFGIAPAHIAVLTPPKPPAKQTQQTARAIRFALLAKWCRHNAIADLLLAHHLEDQAETLLLRLLRGSGLKGLASMEGVSYMADFRILRPLLTVPKARLEATVAKFRLGFVDDPSNRSTKYLRVRARNFLSDYLTKEGVPPQRLAQTATHLARCQAVIQAQTNRLSANCRALKATGEATIELAPFTNATAEIALRLLADTLCLVGEPSANDTSCNTGGDKGARDKSEEKGKGDTGKAGGIGKEEGGKGKAGEIVEEEGGEGETESQSNMGDSTKVRFASLMRLYTLLKNPQEFKPQTLHKCKISISGDQIHIHKESSQ